MLDTVFNVLKVVAVVTVVAAFMVIITNFLGLIVSLVFGNIIGEILTLVSMYLPFNALAVFGALGTSTVAILSFLIAKKIFDLTSWSISAV